MRIPQSWWTPCGRERREARQELQQTHCEEARKRWKETERRATEVEPAARQRCFTEFASTDLNKHAAVGRVTKILKKMEGAIQSVCPGQAINGNRGQLAVEDHAKAEAFVHNYAHFSRNGRLRRRDQAIRAELKEVKSRPCICSGHKTGDCQPFTRQELDAQLRKLKIRRAPGPDPLCAEQLRHLGPVALDAVLTLINPSWERATMPSSWSRAIIIPITKAGKDPSSVENCRPISLTSHLAKLAEQLVSARLTHIADRDELIPQERMG